MSEPGAPGSVASDLARLWDCERDLWLKGEGRHRELVSAMAVMVFPEPAGVMQGEAIFAGVASAPRWARAEITPRAGGGGEHVRTLAYAVQARRDEGGDYRALCSSTWVRDQEAPEGWRLLQHQQTPTG